MKKQKNCDKLHPEERWQQLQDAWRNLPAKLMYTVRYEFEEKMQQIPNARFLFTYFKQTAVQITVCSQ